MHKSVLLLGLVFLSFGWIAMANEPRSADANKQETKATFMITGLHCPPCTKTVENSLRRAKGLQSITVDWKTKKASVSFDETVLPAQKVAQLIAGTPHMMGRNMHYGGWLLLSVPTVKDEASAKQVKEAARKVKGIERVAAYPAQHSIGVSFPSKGAMTSRQLIDALRRAGIEAKL